MSPAEIVAILALTAWAAYKQSQVNRLSLDRGRFKMAIVYAVVGLVIGGFNTPSGWDGWAMIAISLTLSFVVGVVRGRYTRLWVDDGGTAWSKGTAFTVGLFIGLIAVKFALGFAAGFLGIDDGAGFGEVLVMIAIMIAVQAQIVHRRALAVISSTPRTSPAPPAD